jgi:hypothetical protein
VIATRTILIAKARVVIAMSITDKYMMLSLVVIVDGLAVVRRGYVIPEHKKIEGGEGFPPPPYLISYVPRILRVELKACYGQPQPRLDGGQSV